MPGNLHMSNFSAKDLLLCITMNASLSHSGHASLQTRIRAMVDKIEKFNTTGVMEGASSSKNGARLYSSMKQEVMDMSESKYDAEIRKYCIDQPDEALDELQIKMRAFIAKVNCYNQFVDEANRETAISPHKKQAKTGPRKLKLPKLSPQMTGVSKDEQTLKRSAASLSLALVERKRRQNEEIRRKRRLRSTPSSCYVSEESSTSSESYSSFKSSPRYFSKDKYSASPSVRRTKRQHRDLPLPGNLSKGRQRHDFRHSRLPASYDTHQGISQNVGEFYDESPIPNSAGLATGNEYFGQPENQFDDTSTFEHQGRHHGDLSQHQVTSQTERVSLPGIKSSRKDYHDFTTNCKLDQSPELFSTRVNHMSPVRESTPILVADHRHIPQYYSQVRSRLASPIDLSRQRAKSKPASPSHQRKSQLKSRPTSPSEKHRLARGNVVSQPASPSWQYSHSKRRSKSRPTSPMGKSHFSKGRAKSRPASPSEQSSHSKVQSKSRPASPDTQHSWSKFWMKAWPSEQYGFLKEKLKSLLASPSEQSSQSSVQAKSRPPSPQSSFLNDKAKPRTPPHEQYSFQKEQTKSRMMSPSEECRKKYAKPKPASPKRQTKSRPTSPFAGHLSSRHAPPFGPISPCDESSSHTSPIDESSFMTLSRPTSPQKKYSHSRVCAKSRPTSPEKCSYLARCTSPFDKYRTKSRPTSPRRKYSGTKVQAKSRPTSPLEGLTQLLHREHDGSRRRAKSRPTSPCDELGRLRKPGHTSFHGNSKKQAKKSRRTSSQATPQQYKLSKSRPTSPYIESRPPSSTKNRLVKSRPTSPAQQHHRQPIKSRPTSPIDWYKHKVTSECNADLHRSGKSRPASPVESKSRPLSPADQCKDSGKQKSRHTFSRPTSPPNDYLQSVRYKIEQYYSELKSRSVSPADESTEHADTDTIQATRTTKSSCYHMQESGAEILPPTKNSSAAAEKLSSIANAILAKLGKQQTLSSKHACVTNFEQTSEEEPRESHTHLLSHADGKSSPPNYSHPNNPTEQSSSSRKLSDATASVPIATTTHTSTRFDKNTNLEAQGGAKKRTRPKQMCEAFISAPSPLKERSLSLKSLDYSSPPLDTSLCDHSNNWSSMGHINQPEVHPTPTSESYPSSFTHHPGTSHYNSMQDLSHSKDTMQPLLHSREAANQLTESKRSLSKSDQELNLKGRHYDAPKPKMGKKIKSILKIDQESSKNRSSSEESMKCIKNTEGYYTDQPKKVHFELEKTKKKHATRMKEKAKKDSDSEQEIKPRAKKKHSSSKKHGKHTVSKKQTKSKSTQSEKASSKKHRERESEHCQSKVFEEQSHLKGEGEIVQNKQKSVSEKSREDNMKTEINFQESTALEEKKTLEEIQNNSSLPREQQTLVYPVLKVEFVNQIPRKAEIRQVSSASSFPAALNSLAQSSDKSQAQGPGIGVKAHSTSLLSFSAAELEKTKAQGHSKDKDSLVPQDSDKAQVQKPSNTSETVHFSLTSSVPINDVYSPPEHFVKTPAQDLLFMTETEAKAKDLSPFIPSENACNSIQESEVVGSETIQSKSLSHATIEDACAPIQDSKLVKSQSKVHSLSTPFKTSPDAKCSVPEVQASTTETKVVQNSIATTAHNKTETQEFVTKTNSSLSSITSSRNAHYSTQDCVKTEVREEETEVSPNSMSEVGSVAQNQDYRTNAKVCSLSSPYAAGSDALDPAQDNVKTDVHEPSSISRDESRKHAMVESLNSPLHFDTRCNSASQVVADSAQSKDLNIHNQHKVERAHVRPVKKSRKWRFKFHRRYFRGLTFNMQFPKFSYFK